MTKLHPAFRAQEFPHKPAYIMASSGQVVTYGELDQRSNQIAHLFRRLGLQKGDHIAFQMENNVHFLPLVWGAQRSGLIFTPLHTHLQQDEVEYILNNSTAKLFICSARFRAVAERLQRDQLQVAHYFLLDETPEAEMLPGFDNYLAAVAAEPVSPVDDQASGGFMMYSSGTTGKPKGILPNWIPEAWDDLPASLKATAELMGYQNPDVVYLSPAPLYHAAPMGCNMLITAYGGTSIIMEKFDPELALQCIEQYRVTHSQWVPIMFVRMLRLPAATRAKYDLSSLQKVIHAAAPCPVAVKRQIIEWMGPIVVEYYSATEAIGFTWITSEEWLAHPGSVGRGAFCTLYILDEDGNELPPGEVGTIYFSGMQKFEYFNAPGKNEGVFDAQDRGTTGDVGYVDAEGYLYLTDRKHFMIISGGVNIYPQEIEDLLLTHPQVGDVAVFGVPNEEFGEEVKAVVEPLQWPVENPQDLEATLIDWCRSKLSHVKCPRSVDFEQKLPRMENGKLYKTGLRDRYWPAKAEPK